MTTGTPISNAITRALSDMSAGVQESPRINVTHVRSIAERRDEILEKRTQSKAVTAFRKVRRRAGLNKRGPCVMCHLRRSCTAPCEDFDREKPA